MKTKIKAGIICTVPYSVSEAVFLYMYGFTKLLPKEIKTECSGNNYHATLAANLIEYQSYPLGIYSRKTEAKSLKAHEKLFQVPQFTGICYNIFFFTIRRQAKCISSNLLCLNPILLPSCFSSLTNHHLCHKHI